MSSFNRVILMGNLTRDPELRYTPQGTPVTDLSLAVNTTRGGRNQEKKEETLFIDITVWNRQAETCCEYLGKGRSVLVEGRLQQDEWEDRESGQKRRKIKVVASNIQFVGGRGDSGGDSGGDGGGNRGSGGGSRQAPPPSSNQEPSFDSGFDGGDEIPF